MADIHTWTRHEFVTKGFIPHVTCSMYMDTSCWNWWYVIRAFAGKRHIYYRDHHKLVLFVIRCSIFYNLCSIYLFLVCDIHRLPFTSMMSLLPDKYNCGLPMRHKSPECFPRHRLQRKPLVSDPGMHHRTCETHIGNAIPRWWKNIPGIPGAYATRNFAFLARGPWSHIWDHFENVTPNEYELFQDFEQLVLVCFRSTTCCLIVTPNGMGLKLKRQIICQSVIEGLWCYGLIQSETVTYNYFSFCLANGKLWYAWLHCCI